jgi:hypothetical protein
MVQKIASANSWKAGVAALLATRLLKSDSTTEVLASPATDTGSGGTDGGRMAIEHKVQRFLLIVEKALKEG